MGKTLVVVESPAKAKTIEKYLGGDYAVRASYGHIRDLPKSDLGVDVDAGFAVTYEVPPDSEKHVAALKKARKAADGLILATDYDREGEAIAYHVASLLDADPAEARRVTFTEITRDAILEAFQHPREIDLKLFDAQEARRVLDRLVGYKISPLLWRRVQPGLSAGRVQSVALRLIVERERDIRAFTPVEYWSVDVRLTPQEQEQPFLARLVSSPTASSRPRPTRGGRCCRPRRMPRPMSNDCSGRRTESRRLRPKSGRKARVHRSRRRRCSKRRRGASVIRRAARWPWRSSLYEGIDVPGAGRVGLITYMRTDSTNLSELALTEIRGYIGRVRGRLRLQPNPAGYKARTGAQEAHEAIRATSG